MSKTPEEIAALKAKYAAENEAKQKAKEEKKQKFAKENSQRNMPSVEMLIPWETPDEPKKEIDLEKHPWKSLPDALEHGYRVSVWLNSGTWPEYQVKRKIIRT